MTFQMINILPQYKGMLEGDVGLELEVESAVPIQPLERGYWKSKAEGSLRFNGMEFVSRKPFPMDGNFREKILKLTDYVNNPKHGTFKESPRASLHVHCNILKDTPVQVWTRVAAYWLVENLLTKYCGEEQREGNLFCLRLKDADAMLGICVDDLKQNAPFSSFHNDLRYSGQNLAAVWKFGSLEYRSMRGTTDPDVIEEWSTNLHRMGEQAKLFADPSILMDTYFRVGAKRILEHFFTPAFVSKLVKIKDWEGLVDENVLTLTELCYFCNWQAYNDKVVKYYGEPEAPKLKPIKVLRADRVARAADILAGNNPVNINFDVPPEEW